MLILCLHIIKNIGLTDREPYRVFYVFYDKNNTDSLIYEMDSRVSPNLLKYYVILELPDTIDRYYKYLKVFKM